MPSTNACNLCLTRLQDIFLRSRNCWGGLYPLRNMCHNVSQNIFAPHFRVGEERHIWWLDYLWPASQPTCQRSCLSAYDQCHLPTLSHGHVVVVVVVVMTSVIHLVYLTAMPWLLLKTFNSRSASFTKLLLQNKENIMSTLSLSMPYYGGLKPSTTHQLSGFAVLKDFPHNYALCDICH